MRCQRCLDEGQVSKVYLSQWCTSTLVCGQTFYDEYEVLHHHDPNSTTRGFHCSRGHSGEVKTWSGCEACGELLKHTFKYKEPTDEQCIHLGNLTVNQSEQTETWTKR